MLENINDVLSLGILVVIILICIYYTFSIFSKHHEIKLMELESEYYDYNDNDGEDQYL
ncbi:MAG: hypothetical protein MR601_08600 [Erysipelotrichaceae bacterium]|nr:hypothetical protein [Erysipelotrichaceae bacterium]